MTQALDRFLSQNAQEPEGVPPVRIATPKDAENWARDALSVGATSNRTFLLKTAAAVPTQLARNPVARGGCGNDQAMMIARLARIADGLFKATGQLEAQYLRRPNILTSIYTPALAPGATSNFNMQPAVGNSFYRLMGLVATDGQCEIMGFTSLKVGGQEHVQFSQITPTAPVANAVPWAGFQVRESSYQSNIAPWTGQVFQSTIPVLGTIVNMSVAATGDAVTLAARIQWLVQSDPCAVRYIEAYQGAQQYFSRVREFSTALMLGGGGDMVASIPR